MADGPLVSVGIPCYNRPEGLKRTLENITCQTYSNLEIIVSDNCSPDSEVKTVGHYFEEKDSRVRYVRQDENKGVEYNFEYVLSEAKGKYFMWAADDDSWDLTYVEECVKILEEHINVVLCATYAYQGDLLYDNGIDTFARSRKERIKIITKPSGNLTFYGLYRTDIIKHLKLPRGVYGSDIVYTTLVGLFGEIYLIPKALFKHSSAGVSSNRPYEIAEKAFKLRGWKRWFPHFSLFYGNINSISVLKGVSLNDKIMAIFFVLYHYLNPEMFRHYGGDCINVVRYLLSSRAN